MLGDGESKKQTRLAWMEKLLIGMSLLLLIGFGAVLFGVPFLNDAVIRKAQKSVAKALGVGPDPKLLQKGSVSSYSGSGGSIGQLGEKSPMKTIAVTLDVDTPLNRSVTELLVERLKESGKFDAVQFFDMKETAVDDFDRWVSVFIDETNLAASLRREPSHDAKTQTKIDVKYFVIADTTNQTLRHYDFPIADPLVNASSGSVMKRELSYPGSISFEDLRPMLPELLAEDIASQLVGSQDYYRKRYGDLPPDLSKDFWPAQTPVESPAVLSRFPHRQIRMTHGFLTSCDALWLIEVPSMELRDFYRRIQGEFLSKGFTELTQHKNAIQLNNEIFKIPRDCIARSNSPDHNDLWEIYPAPRPELIGEDDSLQEKASPAATTRLYLHYSCVMPDDEYRELVRQILDDPKVSLEKALMFRKAMTNENRDAYEELLKRFDTPATNLMLEVAHFEANHKKMSDEQRSIEWKRLFIRHLKEDKKCEFESILSGIIDWQVKRKIFESFADDLRAAGIPELSEIPSINLKLMPGDVFTAFIANPAGNVVIVKTELNRYSAGGTNLKLEVRSPSGSSATSPSLASDGKPQSIITEYNGYRVDGTARILNPTTGEVEVELKKGKP